MKALALSAVAVAGLSLYALAQSAQAQGGGAAEAVPDDAPSSDTSSWDFGRYVQNIAATASQVEDTFSEFATNGFWTMPTTKIAATLSGSDKASANVRAGLSLIEYAEGTGQGGRDPYRTCYAYKHTISSFADHPAVTGEWSGERLPDTMCADAGYSPGCVSTAAGRYQIKKSTWLRARRALKLADFTPQSQDAAAVWIIKQRGGLDALKRGDVATFAAQCRLEWASLPGAGYGQGERSLSSLMAAYQGAGGVLA